MRGGLYLVAGTLLVGLGFFLGFWAIGTQTGVISRSLLPVLPLLTPLSLSALIGTGLLGGIVGTLLRVRSCGLNACSTGMTHPSREDKRRAMLISFAGLTVYLLFPMGHLVCVYWMWNRLRHHSGHVDCWGRETLNFQLTISCYIVASLLLGVILVGYLFVVVFSLFHLVITLWAMVRAGVGRSPCYPITVKFIR